MEDDEYKKLPPEERCVHKLWKARVSAYEEVTKLFRQIDDEKSPEFGKYLGLVKKFVIDSNAMGQEKGLEATLAYVENYANAGKTVSEVMSGIVTKCVAAPKVRTRELAMQVSLMYVEIEKHDFVLEELLKGTEQKNPKIVLGCVQILTQALREFGIKVISPKPIIKRIGPLFSDRDKSVRDETRAMVIELYKWMGQTLRIPLQSANLQPVQMSDLEAEFAKIEGEKPSPTRYLRSQQQKQAVIAAHTETADNNEEEEDEGEAVQDVDPYDLIDPVDILSKLPKDFYEKIEAKKWQERKEALESVETLIKNPKLENGDYGDLVRALKKVVQKDSNVVCVALAGKCIAGLAAGLKKKFQTYAGCLVLPLLEKFKEKKQNVVTAIKEAIDATYLTTTLEPLLEDILEALNNKNPSVKAETSLFLARAFTKTQPTLINKKILKALTTALTKNINESDPAVRESSAEALGTLMKLVGEKSISPFLVDLEKDKLKMDKIREFHDKAEIVVKIVVPKKRPQTAPTKSGTKKENTAGPITSKTVVKKTIVTAPAKKKAASASTVSAGSATVVRSKGAKASTKPLPKIEKELDDAEVDAIIENLLPSNIVSDLSDSAWKTRLAASEEILAKVQSMEGQSIPSQAVVKTFLKKPGLKETNFNVLKVKLEIIKYIAENSFFSTTTVNCCLGDITEKFSDSKNGTLVGETLSAMAEATSFGQVSAAVLEAAFAQKSPKVQQEALNWLAGALKEFGIRGIEAKCLIEYCRTALSSNNQTVRHAAIGALGMMYLYMGSTLNVFFENEKPALRELINAEFDKYEGQTAPAPSRGKNSTVSKSASANSLDAVEDVAEEEPATNLQDLIPRVDISGQITEALLNELSDKNWKERIEALNKLNLILQEAKFIKSNLGDLPQPLATRLTDSNVKIAQTALNICQTIAKAMGPSSKQYIRVWFPGFIQNLGDSKPWMRTSALDTIKAFSEQCGFKEFFDGEMIADALKVGSPTLRSELWVWLAQVLPKIPLKSIPKEELLACVSYLYNNLEDRNADVRKNAGEAVLGLMIHLGYETMLKQTEKVKPGSRSTVVTALEKQRPNLPMKPLPKKTSPEEEKVVRGTKPVANKQNAVKAKSAVKASTPTVSSKKEEDIDTSPLLVVNNLKHQRTIDESKLKVLKWNFTQPREEFFELLKDQMTVANINKMLIANMFHSDFRFHIKAIESLMDDLSEHNEALIANLDLILKWFTLRFFDTNPSVLLKGLEYLHSVFNMLMTKQYKMLENEGSSFVPYLILKIGDPKDSVRNGVRALLKLITGVLPVSRLSVYLMEGIKSKNARQRAECLDVMGTMIANYGITIWQPTPAACLKEVAKQISDRDNAVRNAALNCVVQAYNLVGEKVYKMVGNISDKDMSLLEERIKRSSRKLPLPKNSITVAELPSAPQNVIKEIKVINDDEQDMDDEDVLPMPVPALPPAVAAEVPKTEVQGPFKLQPEFMNDLDKITPHFTKLPVEKIDLEFLKEEVKMPSFFDNKVKIMPLSPPKPVTAYKYSFYKTSSVPIDPDVQKALMLLDSHNLDMATKGLNQLIDYMNNPLKTHSLQSNSSEFEKEFSKSILSLLSYLHTLDPLTDRNVAKLYRDLFRCMDTFYQNNNLGRHVPEDVIQKLVNELIVLLVEQKLETCDGTYAKAINIFCVKIMERSDHTAVLCALIKLLTDCITNESPERHIDLAMKCLWKMIKSMPSWGDDVEYESVLLVVHHFLIKFPTKWWTTRSVDTPLRTIKTILHSIVKIKGASTTQLLGKIPNPSESDIESYIFRLLKSLKIAQTQDVPLQSQKNSLSRANHNLLTEIFQKIGNKENTHEGLNLLYDFIEQHPEAEIEPFLSKSSKFFQDYINISLKEISNVRKQNNFDKIPDGDVNGSGDINPEQTPEYFEERLNRWKHIWDELMAGRTVDHSLWPLAPAQ